MISNYYCTSRISIRLFGAGPLRINYDWKKTKQLKITVNTESKNNI